MRIVILGLTITSSWGNGHATTFRGLVRGLARRGHSVLFLERDKPWYADNRDLPAPPFGETQIYTGLDELSQRWAAPIAAADLVVVGSYVPDGIAVCTLVQRLSTGVTAFDDIDTPVTLAALADGGCDYLTPDLLRGFGLYLSFTGGPTLQYLESTLGAAMARPSQPGAASADTAPGIEIRAALSPTRIRRVAQSASPIVMRGACGGP